MSQLAWGFISKSNRRFVFVLFGAFSGPEMVPGVGVGGAVWLPEMLPATVEVHVEKSTLHSPAVTSCHTALFSLFSAAPIPRVHSGAM